MGRRSELVDLSCALMAIRSTAGRLDELAAVMDLAVSKVPGLSLERFGSEATPSVLVSNRPCGWRGTYRLLLNAHLDVVDGLPEHFDPRVRDGRILGRGACDMKAAAAAEILAFRDMVTGVDMPLALQLVTDEETGGFGGTRLQLDDGVRADFALAGEPTDLEIVHETKGVLEFRIAVAGKAAHASQPWEGVNAVRRVVEFLAQVGAAFPEPKEEVWRSTLNMATVTTTNQAGNIVPADCSACIQIRNVPHESADSLVSRIEGMAHDGVAVTCTMAEPPQSTPGDDPDIVVLSEVCREIVGTDPALARRHFGTDIRYFTARGQAGVAFGPVGAGLHAAVEWVDIDSLELYHKVLRLFISRLDDRPRGS